MSVSTMARLGRNAEARAEFMRAAALAGNERDKEFLRGRAGEMSPQPSSTDRRNRT
jgi:predicted RNA polymerase sigma factor